MRPESSTLRRNVTVTLGLITVLGRAFAVTIITAPDVVERGASYDIAWTPWEKSMLWRKRELELLWPDLDVDNRVADALTWIVDQDAVKDKRYWIEACQGDEMDVRHVELLTGATSPTTEGLGTYSSPSPSRPPNRIIESISYQHLLAAQPCLGDSVVELPKEESNGFMTPSTSAFGVPSTVNLAPRNAADDTSPSSTSPASSTFTPHNPLLPSDVTTTAALATSTSEAEHTGLSTGGKIGIGVGVALAIVWLVIGTLFFCRVHRRETRVDRSDPEGGNGKLRINGKTFAIAIKPDNAQKASPASPERHDEIEIETVTPKPVP
ncbi:hypothetical protein EJ04DRAFT_560945 [Polyplosphaeria fusca]|uniref:Uncharacterized protein n=1 Tax=Polyplosphaeria fusca TaxID=682080 RepID=A0A9P4R3I3_9PLEO|nr:hypothetical protein EJ04DRAFT_560945 [Polyplosphaeria fusca]